MSGIALLPSWTAALPANSGAFMLNDGRTIPAGWGPEPRDYTPAAMPTLSSLRDEPEHVRAEQHRGRLALSHQTIL